MMSFSEAIKTCATTKYATCKGRATRAEYWWWILFYYLVMLGTVIIGIAIVNTSHEEGFAIIALIPILFFIVPNICVLVRRLHDAGYSGWAMCFTFIPYVGGIIVFVLTLLDSAPDNKYGPNPKNLYGYNNFYGPYPTNQYGQNPTNQYGQYPNNQYGQNSNNDPNNPYNNPQNQWQ